MKPFWSWIQAVMCCAAAVVYAQSGQSNQSSTGAQGTHGSSSGWSWQSSSSGGSGSANGGGSSSSGGSSGGFSSGSGSAGGSASGGSFASGGGSASGTGSTTGSGMVAGKPTHTIIYRLESGNPSSPASGQAFDQHTRHLTELRKKGKVLLFGPWRDHPGSMAIIVAKNDEEAQTIAKSDPAVQSGALTYEVRAGT